MRSRKWFITINDGAECWHKFRDIVKDLTRCKYAYIIHDKEDNLHCHIVLNFDNARTFESLLNTFTGAHIEECRYFNMSIRYLVHQDDNEKYQYNIDDIVSNYSNAILREFMNCDEYVHLDTESLLLAINDGSVRSITEAVKMWGINQVNTKRSLIDTLIKEHSYFVLNGEQCKQLQHENIMLKAELNIYKTIYGDLEKGDFKCE